MLSGPQEQSDLNDLIYLSTCPTVTGLREKEAQLLSDRDATNFMNVLDLQWWANSR